MNIKTKNFFSTGVTLIKGFIIGAAAIAPGISGSSLSIIFGIYKRIINIIATIPKSIKENLSFIIPIIIGVLIGFISVAKGIDYIIEQGRHIPLFFCFIGLMIGTIPFQYQEANKKEKRSYDKIFFLITLIIALCLGWISKKMTAVESTPNLFILLIVGFIMGLSVILPGISSAALLSMLGVYATINSAIANLNLGMLMPIGIGAIVTILVLAKLINYLFRKYHNQTNYAILGLVIGSIPALFPGFSQSIIENIFATSLFFISILITYHISKVEAKKEA